MDRTNECNRYHRSYRPSSEVGNEITNNLRSDNWLEGSRAAYHETTERQQYYRRLASPYPISLSDWHSERASRSQTSDQDSNILACSSVSLNVTERSRMAWEEPQRISQTESFSVTSWKDRRSRPSMTLADCKDSTYDHRLGTIERKLRQLDGQDIPTKFSRLERSVMSNIKQIENKINEMRSRRSEPNHEDADQIRRYNSWGIGRVTMEYKKALDLFGSKERLEEKEKELAHERRNNERLKLDLKKLEDEKLAYHKKLRFQEVQIIQLTEDLETEKNESKQAENIKHNLFNCEAKLHKVQGELTSMKEDESKMQEREEDLKYQINRLSLTISYLQAEAINSQARIAELEVLIEERESEIVVLHTNLKEERQRGQSESPVKIGVNAGQVELREMKSKMTAMERQHEESVSEIARLENQLSSAEADLKDRTDSHEALAKTLDEREEEIKVLQMKLRDNKLEGQTETHQVEEKLEKKLAKVDKMQCQISSMERQLGTSASETVCLKSENSYLRDELSKAEGSLKDREEPYDMLKEASKERKSLINVLESRSREHKETDEHKNVKEDLGAMSSELAELQRRISSVEKQNKISVSEIARLESQLSKAEADLDDKNKFHESFDKKSKDKEQAVRDELTLVNMELSETKHKLLSTQGELDMKVKEVKKISDQFYEMEVKYNGTVNQMEKLKNQLANAEANVSEAGKSYELLQKTSKEKELAVSKEHDLTMNELNEMKNEVASTTPDLLITRTELQKAKNELLALKTANKEKDKEILTLKKQAESLTETLGDKEAKIRDLSKSCQETCSGLEITPKLSEQSSAQEIITKLETQIQVLTMENEQLKQKNEYFELKLSETEGNSRLLKVIEDDLEMALGDIEKLMASKTALKERCTQLEEKLEKKDTKVVAEEYRFASVLL